MLFYVMKAYNLCSGFPLFNTDDGDNVQEDDLAAIFNFNPSKLAKIKNTYARNLVSQLLNTDPKRRARMKQVLAHPFITGTQAPRMVGEEPEFDVFISYRVESDAAHAELLYNLLTKNGVKVWWDKMCLERGVSWEAG